MTPSNQRLAGRFGRIWRLFGLAVAGAMLVAFIQVAPIWGYAVYREIVPRKVERDLIDVALRSVLGAYLLGLVAASAGVIVAAISLEKATKVGRRRPRWALKALALGASFLFAAALMEAIAGTREVLAARVPQAPKPGDGLREPRRRDVSGRPGRGPISIVVLGESSARGEPYHPDFSAGQAAGWALERVFPGREVEVDVRALGGVPLEKMDEILFEEVSAAPDAVLIYSGHNEFQYRFGWDSWTSYYVDDDRNYMRESLLRKATALTPVSRLLRSEADRQWIDSKPPLVVTRGLVDRPVCSAEQRATILRQFEARLERMVAYTESIGALPILVVPAGNDSGFDPSRSYLAPSTEEPDRRAFAGRFKAARSVEATDPAGAIAEYRALIAAQPSFSESHFRLARLLEARGDLAEARAEFVEARDLDGLPMRCPSDFQEVYRKVAARHDAVLVDAQAVLEAISPRGILGDHAFHDGQHPSFPGYVAIAQAIVDGLAARKAFGWPEGTPSPTVDADECGRRAALDAPRWESVCARSATFLRRLSFVRHDPAFRLDKMRRWEAAEKAIEAGKRPEETAVPGFGVHPEGLRPPKRR